MEAAQRKDDEIVWSKKLNTWTKKLNVINLNSENAISLINKINEKIDEAKRELEKVNKRKAEGAMVRARTRWVQEGEHCTKYFLNLEKAKAKAKAMNKIETEKGEIVTNSSRILEEQVKFYQALYTKDKNVKFDFVDSPVKLDEEHKERLESEFQIEELSMALFSMANDKSPGRDGLTVNWYKIGTKIKLILFGAIKESIQQGKFYDNALKGVISLIPKKSHSRAKLSEWHPISLLCVDYKLFSKILANRIKTTLPKIIHPDQTGFQKGKDISENLRIMMDVIDFCMLKQLPAIVVQVDFMKAFDRVDYEALYKTMEYFNFGPKCCLEGCSYRQ